MKNFRVLKGVDAFAIYSQVVPAETIAEANAIASTKPNGWIDEKETRVYDDSVILEDETIEWDTETIGHLFSGPARDTILASLRAYQAMPEVMRMPFMPIATNMGTCEPLTDEEIDALCEEINA